MTDKQRILRLSCNKFYLLMRQSFKTWQEGKSFLWESDYQLGAVNFIVIGGQKCNLYAVKRAIDTVFHRPLKLFQSVLWADRFEPAVALAKLEIYRKQNPMEPNVVDKTWVDIVSKRYLPHPTTKVCRISGVDAGGPIKNILLWVKKDMNRRPKKDKYVPYAI